MNYPYQINTFLSQEPEVGEPIYTGERGWFPHLNIKRRFGLLNGVAETELIEALDQFAAHSLPLDIKVRPAPIRPDFMPVTVLEVEPTDELMDLHSGLVRFLGDDIASKFPEREKPYYPHITLEDYEGRPIVDPAIYAGRIITIDHLWLVKDPEISDNSQALARFSLTD